MEKLGIDPILIVTQVVNFFLLMYVLKKYIYQPVLHTLAERKERAEKAEALQDELEQQRADIENEREKVMEQAKIDADALLSQMKVEGNAVKQKIEDEAQEKAAHIVAKAEDQMKSKEVQIKQGLEANVQKAAMHMAESVLGSELTTEQKDAFLRESVARFAQ